MMRKFGLILAAFLISAAAGVQAQVAAPSFNPFFTSGNPAVLPLSGSSQAGVGIVDLEATYTTGGSTFDFATGSGTFVNLRWVGESFGIGYQQFDLELEGNAAIGGGTFTMEESTIEMGLRLGDSPFLLGVALETDKEKDPLGSGEDIQETSLTNVGGVWKLGDTFYLGGTYGTETTTREDSSQLILPSTVESEGEHEVYRYGAALYSRDKESGYHLELHREESTVLEIVDPAGNSQYLASYEETGIVVEFIFSDFLIGIEATNSYSEDADINNLFSVETADTSRRTVSLGYVPLEGFNVILFSMEEEQTNDAGDVLLFTATGAMVSWAF